MYRNKNSFSFGRFRHWRAKQYSTWLTPYFVKYFYRIIIRRNTAKSSRKFSFWPISKTWSSFSTDPRENNLYPDLLPTARDLSFFKKTITMSWVGCLFTKQRQSFKFHLHTFYETRQKVHNFAKINTYVQSWLKLTNNRFDCCSPELATRFIRPEKPLCTPLTT